MFGITVKIPLHFCTFSSGEFFFGNKKLDLGTRFEVIAWNLGMWLYHVAFALLSNIFLFSSQGNDQYFAELTAVLGQDGYLKKPLLLLGKEFNFETICNSLFYA